MPARSIGTSTAALSVSTVTTFWPGCTMSPGRTKTAVTVAASIPSPSSGKRKSLVVGVSKDSAATPRIETAGLAATDAVGVDARPAAWGTAEGDDNPTGVSVLLSCVFARRRRTGVSMGILSPGWTSTASTTPAVSTGTSTAALSVSTVKTFWPACTASPGRTATAVTVTVSIPSPKGGKRNSIPHLCF